jgi:peptidoglycan/LPS O-acetylase OafA/YrhL
LQPVGGWLFANVIYFSLLSIAIVPLVAAASQLTTVPRGFRTLVYRTSLYSYSMYLSHALVIFFAHPVIYHVVSSLFGEFRGLTFVVAPFDLGVVYGISAVVYYAWEAPLTRLRERYSAPAPRARQAHPPELATPSV